MPSGLLSQRREAQVTACGPRVFPAGLGGLLRPRVDKGRRRSAPVQQGVSGMFLGGSLFSRSEAVGPPRRSGLVGGRGLHLAPRREFLRLLPGLCWPRPGGQVLKERGGGPSLWVVAMRCPYLRLSSGLLDTALRGGSSHEGEM